MILSCCKATLFPFKRSHINKCSLSCPAAGSEVEEPFNTMFGFYSAKPTIRRIDLIFFLISRSCFGSKQKHHRCLHKLDAEQSVIGLQVLYHVYGDINSQVSLCACKNQVLNMIQTGMKLTTGLLKFPLLKLSILPL